MTSVARKAFTKNVEWEFDRISLPRELSRNAVRHLLVERAEKGGWELRRVQIGNDGIRRVVLRRKIIRQPQPQFFYL